MPTNSQPAPGNKTTFPVVGPAVVQPFGHSPPALSPAPSTTNPCPAAGSPSRTHTPAKALAEPQSQGSLYLCSSDFTPGPRLLSVAWLCVQWGTAVFLLSHRPSRSPGSAQGSCPALAARVSACCLAPLYALVRQPSPPQAEGKASQQPNPPLLPGYPMQSCRCLGSGQTTLSRGGGGCTSKGA